MAQQPHNSTAMANGTAAVLEPTFTGYVASTLDALILFEACLSGVLHHVPRRPHDRERSQLVRSGSVFIYEENASGIKRWTDGVTWSPSRILGNFLVYRELDKPFPPGEKKRAMKKNTRRPQQPGRPGEPYPRPQDTPNGQNYSPTSTSPASANAERPPQSEFERALVGSLVDSYGFKENGLVKKTMSVTVSGVTHHLVSYYTMDDVMRGILRPPTMFDHLKDIRPRIDLTSKQNFRAPMDDLEQSGIEAVDPSQIYQYSRITDPSQMYARPMSLPQVYPDGRLIHQPQMYPASRPANPPQMYSDGRPAHPQQMYSDGRPANPPQMYTYRQAPVMPPPGYALPPNPWQYMSNAGYGHTMAPPAQQNMQHQH